MVDALAPDLLLCDIARPDLNGLEVAAAIDRLDNPPAVVFVTAFDRYAVAAFDVAAVDYLLKPVSPERLARALARVREWRAADHGNQRKSQWITEFWVQNRGEMLRIDAGPVDLTEAERDYMPLHVGPRRWLIHQTLKSLKARVDPDRLIRIHRSHMVRRVSIAGARSPGRGHEWRAADHGNQRKSQWITEFWVQNRGEMLRIDAGQVDLSEAERDYRRLHVGARSWLIHQTIKSLEARMDPDRFIRIHRSKMVRRDGIAGLRHHGDGAWSVDLGDGGVHRIGRTYLHDVKAIMQD